MSKQASVAVCIPTYNQAQYLLESVGSALSSNLSKRGSLGVRRL
jgi:glycosyltransferase involved in cell wall biosynthesis